MKKKDTLLSSVHVNFVQSKIKELHCMLALCLALSSHGLFKILVHEQEIPTLIQYRSKYGTLLMWKIKMVEIFKTKTLDISLIPFKWSDMLMTWALSVSIKNVVTLCPNHIQWFIFIWWLKCRKMHIYTCSHKVWFV